jgi:hypothetical protein
MDKPTLTIPEAARLLGIGRLRPTRLRVGEICQRSPSEGDVWFCRLLWNRCSGFSVDHYLARLIIARSMMPENFTAR